ncbi:ABC transporter permease [Pectinatus frisingensis]|uniref:ABC transporter permease n=1 Tax=Pectinatus frisingensis TaxID=865 RepID=UPI0018C7A424|nr:ABC transporter permease [Pectinatus frisingensis]
MSKINIIEMYKYRFLLKELVTRDLKIKYRRSFLGYLWSLMNPLLMMWILTLVFSYVFRFDIPNYPLYLIIGQTIFGFFSESTSMAMMSVIENAALLKKVYVPKYIFPISRVLSSFVTMIFSLMAIFIVMKATGVPFKITLLALPLSLFFVLLFSVGVGMFIAAITVYLRDMMHLYSVVLTAWSFLTPIFYPISIVPQNIRWILQYNPLYYFIDYFRQIVLYDTLPSLHTTVFCFELSIAAVIIGGIVFKKLQKNYLLYI